MSIIDDCLDGCLDILKDVLTDEDNQKIAAGVIVGGGLIGAGISVYTMYKAEEVRDEGKVILDDAKEKYYEVRNKMSTVVEALNKKKLEISSGSVSDFIRLLSQIRNVQLTNVIHLEELRNLTPYRDFIPELDETEDAGINWWLAAIPIIGPLTVYCDADEALSKAKIFRQQAKQVAARLEQKCSLCTAMTLRAEQIKDILEEADGILTQMNRRISYEISSNGCDWDGYSQGEQNFMKKMVKKMVNMVLFIKMIIGTSLLYEDGVSIKTLQEQLRQYAI